MKFVIDLWCCCCGNFFFFVLVFVLILFWIVKFGLYIILFDFVLKVVDLCCEWGVFLFFVLFWLGWFYMVCLYWW